MNLLCKSIYFSFNPCPPTLLKAALKRINETIQDKIDAFKTPSVDTINAIISSAAGDIRCATNQYYFAALKGKNFNTLAMFYQIIFILTGTQELPTIATSEQKSGTKRKRLPAKTSAIKSMMRDESLGLFHGLGRVLNPKREHKGKHWVIQCDFDQLIDEFSSQPNTIENFLFENYVKYFGDAEDVCKAADVLSVSEALLNNWKDKYDSVVMGLWFIVLGLMVYNKHKVSKWNQLKAPTKIKKT